MCEITHLYKKNMCSLAFVEATDLKFYTHKVYPMLVKCVKFHKHWRYEVAFIISSKIFNTNDVIVEKIKSLNFYFHISTEMWKFW